MKTIIEYYWEWVDEQPEDNEDVDNPFNELAHWKGHMVKGFIGYILKENEKK